MKFKIEKGDRFEFFTLVFLRLTLLLAILFGIFEKNWLTVFYTCLIFLLTFLPNLFEKKYKIMLPIEFEVGIIFFIYASLFLGEVKGYYTTFWWWDLLLHASAGLGFGFIGFIIFYTAYKKQKIKVNPSLAMLFSFFFALGIGSVWEIFEFAMDQIIGTNMQKSGLVDTMWDMIVNAVGALIVSLIGYGYLKKKKQFLFSKLINKFLKENKI